MGILKCCTCLVNTGVMIVKRVCTLMFPVEQELVLELQFAHWLWIQRQPEVSFHLSRRCFDWQVGIELISYKWRFVSGGRRLMSCFSFRQFSNQLDMKLSCWQLSVDPTKKEPIPRCHNSLLDGNEAFQEARLCFAFPAFHSTICGSCGSSNILNLQNRKIQESRTPVDLPSRDENYI